MSIVSTTGSPTSINNIQLNKDKLPATSKFLICRSTADCELVVPAAPSTARTVVPSPQSANPYVRTSSYYVNPTYQAELRSSIATASGQVKTTLQSMLQVSSAYWIDVKAKITGFNSTSTVEGILYDASTKATKQLVTLIVYDLPNRDCHVSSHKPDVI